MDWKSLSRRPQNRMIKNFKEQVEGFAQRGNSGIVEIKNYIKAEFMLLAQRFIGQWNVLFLFLS